MRTLKLLALSAVVALSLNAEAPKQPAKADVKALKAEMMKKWKAYGKSAQAAAKGISVEELIEWENQDKEFVLVDVREPGEVAAGKIIAINFKAIPRGMVAPKIGKALAFTPDQTLVFYCKLGFRSAMVAKEIQEVFGYKNVYYLKGGIMEWLKKGHMVENALGEMVKH